MCNGKLRVRLNFLLLINILFFVAGCNNSKSETASITDKPTAAKTDSAQAKPANPPANFKSAIVNVNGVDIHYVTGGEGEPLVLVHGFGQNWYMWNRLLPELSKHFTIIAPDLRGVGESGKPADGYDKKNMAKDIHELVKKLGYSTINLAGHDIGLMVAYAYAAQYANEVKRIALLDALLPGIEPVWTNASTSKWHFGFFDRPIAGDLVTGQEDEFLRDFWPQQSASKKDPFSTEESTEFIRAYSIPGAISGSFKWFQAFRQDVEDNHQFMKEKLKMPMLALGGETSAGRSLTDHLKLVATNVKGIEIKGAGHWIVQEQTDQVEKELLDFFWGK